MDDVLAGRDGGVAAESGATTPPSPSGTTGTDVSTEVTSLSESVSSSDVSSPSTAAPDDGPGSTGGSSKAGGPASHARTPDNSAADSDRTQGGRLMSRSSVGAQG